MSRPIERLLAMDEMIRCGQYPPAQMFMQRFNISERAVYGDLRYLKERFHAPLAYSKRHGGYYYGVIGWNLAKAEAFQEMEEAPVPTVWLWREIARRFGQEQSLALHRAYVQRLLPKPEHACDDCGVPLPSRRLKWCDVCCASHHPNKGKREGDQRVHPKDCEGCGKPLAPHKQKWCQECARKKQNESQRNWYRNLSPEQKEALMSRVKAHEQRSRWEKEGWRENYNEKRRTRGQKEE